MGIGQSKNDENNSMEDIKNLRVDEKTRADTLIIKSIQVYKNSAVHYAVHQWQFHIFHK